SGCAFLPTLKNGQMIDTYRGAVIKFICNPGYLLVGSSQIYCDGSAWSGSFPLCTAYARTAPSSCDFELPYICGWSQDPFHAFNWSRHNYQTPSRNLDTGPSFDHTLGPGKGGYYMFIETSSPRIENDTARLFSPVFSPNLTVSQPSCFIFWYHMYGAATGILNVYVKPEDIPFDGNLSPKFTKFGNQGDEWFQGIVQLPRLNIPFQVVIEALRGSSYVSDIAIDDVEITNGSKCIDMSVTTPIESSSPSTPYLVTMTSRTIRGGANFTFPTPPPLPPLPPFPSLEPFTEMDRITDSSEYFTLHSSTETYKTNYSQMPVASTFVPQHPIQVFSTTEQSKRIPIPAEPTPLILQPVTAVIRRITEQSPTKSSTKLTTLLTSTSTPIMPITTTTTKKPIITTKLTTLKATTKSTTKLMKTTVKPVIIPKQRITTKLPTTQTVKTTTSKQYTIKALTTRPTTKIKPIVPVIIPKLTTAATSTMKTTMQESILEKMITFDVKLEPDVTTEKTEERENSGKATRGKKWLEARRGPIPERKKSLSISSIAGILAAVMLVIAAVTIAGYFYVKHRRRARRQSCIAEDSDVRFLTSDEVLDFSLARPNDSGDDDL
ncbi:hypothetical protein L9F63_024216, partial [Diploptera punctata]